MAAAATSCTVNFFGSVGHAGNHFLDHAKSTTGAKNLFFKPIKYGLDWAVKAGGVELSPEMQALSNIARDGKNALGATEIASALVKIGRSIGEFVEKPTLGTGWEIVPNIFRASNPVFDLTELLQARQVTYFSQETMTAFSNFNSAALFIGMTDTAVRSVVDEVKAIGVWGQSQPKDIHGPALALGAPGAVVAQQSQASMDETAAQAWRKAGLILLDIIKAVSYIALATIALIAAFIVAIPNAGLLILACSTSALFFTLFNEFAGRSYAEYVEAAFEQTRERVNAADAAAAALPAAPGAAAPAVPAAPARTPAMIAADRAAFATYAADVSKAGGKPMKLPFLPVVSA